MIAVADDSQAPGVFQAVTDLSLRVPQDLSILGFGNQEPASSQALGLTTVEWPLREMTQGAVEAVISAIEKPRKAKKVERLIVPTRAVWRSSVARP